MTCQTHVHQHDCLVPCLYRWYTLAFLVLPSYHLVDWPKRSRRSKASGLESRPQTSPGSVRVVRHSRRRSRTAVFPSTGLPRTLSYKYTILDGSSENSFLFIYLLSIPTRQTISKNQLMLFRLQLLFLFGALVHSYAVSLFSRDNGQLTDGAKEALQGVGIDLSKRHVRPKQVSTPTILTAGRVLTCAESTNDVGHRRLLHCRYRLR
jgi:hypothetical protein